MTVLGHLHLSQLPIVPPQPPLETRCENLLGCRSGAGCDAGKVGMLLAPHGQRTRGARILPQAMLAVPDQKHACPCSTPHPPVGHDLKPQGRSCTVSLSVTL